MTKNRYAELMVDDHLDLTTEEIKEGWHFCVEFDGLLVGPGSSELEFCRCLPPELLGKLKEALPKESEPAPLPEWAKRLYE